MYVFSASSRTLNAPHCKITQAPNHFTHHNIGVGSTTHRPHPAILVIGDRTEILTFAWVQRRFAIWSSNYEILAVIKMLYGTRIEIELYVFSDLTQTQKDTGTLTNAKYSATWKSTTAKSNFFNKNKQHYTGGQKQQTNNDVSRVF